jgi:hypothetical protein
MRILDRLLRRPAPTPPPEPPVEVREWRPVHGTCPGCGAAEDQWCAADCPTLDPMDHR